MKLNFKLLLLLITLAVTLPASAQFNLKKAISGGAKAVKALTLTDALKDGISSAGGVAAALSDSQLGTLTQSLINAKYSQKQENEADDCGYDFLVSKGKNPWGRPKRDDLSPLFFVVRMHTSRHTLTRNGANG